MINAFEISLTIYAGWLELTWMYIGRALVLLNSLKVFLPILRVTSKKLNNFKLEFISILTPIYLNALITLFCIFDVKGLLLLGIEINQSSL